MLEGSHRGLVVGDFGTWGFVLDWTLSENEGDSLIGSFHKSYLEKGESRPRSRPSLLEERQSLALDRDAGSLVCPGPFRPGSDLIPKGSRFCLGHSRSQTGLV